MNKNLKEPKVAKDKSDIVRELPAACADERLAVEFMEAQRWQGKPYCPHCGVAEPAMMRDRDGGRSKRFLWRCVNGCKSQFSVRIGTVLEDSRIPLRHWCYAFWAACSSKKGVSALQIKRMTGLSYKSALFLMHRIRFAMATEPGGPKLGGNGRVVEADETYVGGRPRFPQPFRKDGKPNLLARPLCLDGGNDAMSAPEAGAPTPGAYRVEPSENVRGAFHYVKGPNGIVYASDGTFVSAERMRDFLNAAYAAGLEAAARRCEAFADPSVGIIAAAIRALAGADQKGARG